MKNDNYSVLKKHLEKFENLLKTAELTTDEVGDLLDRVGWLQEVLSEKETMD